MFYKENGIKLDCNCIIGLQNMEFQEIIKTYQKHKIEIFLSLLVGAGLGAAYFISPKSYQATGSLYIKRSVDTLKFKYFAYEGYYAQQTGLAYTNTVMTLIQSPDIRFEALNKLNLPTDTFSLRKYARLITARKTGPQLVQLTVKSKNPEEAKKLWETVVESTIEKNKLINTAGDPLLTVSKISDNPLVRETYRPLWLCALSGALATVSFVVFLITLKGFPRWK